jgi:hypothetical protein
LIFRPKAIVIGLASWPDFQQKVEN